MARDESRPAADGNEAQPAPGGRASEWRCVECNFRVASADRPLSCPHCGRVDEDLPLGVDLFGPRTEGGSSA